MYGTLFFLYFNADPEWQEFEQRYARAVESSALVKLNVTKCTTIGPPGVGKTCLKYLLTNRKWDKDEGTASTDVMEAPEWIECYSVEEGEAKGLWKLMANEEINAATLKAIDFWADSNVNITSTPATKSRKQPPMPTNSEQLAAVSSSAEVSTTASTITKQYSAPSTIAVQASIAPTSTEQHASFSTSASHLSGTSTKTSSAATPDSKASEILSCMQLLEAISHSKDVPQWLKDKKGVVLDSAHLIYFIDTGGQAIYHDVHPVLITSPSVYLVVFNLNDIHGKSDDKKLMSEYFRSSLIQRPLRSIQTFGFEAAMSGEQGFPQDPKIFIIGTHLDMLPQGNRVKILDCIHQVIAEEISHAPYRQFVQYDSDGRSFWAVDNTVAGREPTVNSAKYISLLREGIQDRTLVISRDVPIPWLLLRLVMIGKGVQYCTYSQLLEEAESMGYIKDSRNELNTMLHLFHMLGLVYFRVPEGCDINDSLVFIDPECLYSSTTTFLMAAKQELEDVHRSNSDGLSHVVLKQAMDASPRPRKRRIQLADPFEETVEMCWNCKSQSLPQHKKLTPVTFKCRKIEVSMLETQYSRESARVVEKNIVLRRMQKNLMQTWIETAELLQKVEKIMMNLHQAPMRTVLESICDSLKEEKDSSKVTSSGQLTVTSKRITVNQKLLSRLKLLSTLGEAAVVKQQLQKVLDDFWLGCRKMGKSIQSTDVPLFLALLSDLRIIAQLHGSQFADSEYYVIPLALPMPKASKATRVTNSNSILITVLSQGPLRACYLPSGLFCALLSSLVATSKWAITPLDREHVVFAHNSVRGLVHIIEWDPFLEIYLEAETPPRALNESCRIVKIAVDEGLRDLYRKFFHHQLPTSVALESSPIIWGVPCKAHPSKLDERTHIAAFQRDEDECWAECLLEGSFALQPVSKEQLMWFTDKC